MAESKQQQSLQFCGRSEQEVSLLISGMTGIYATCAPSRRTDVNDSFKSSEIRYRHLALYLAKTCRD